MDFRADLWADGVPVATHEGGYTPFVADVPDIARRGEFELAVSAADDPHDLRLRVVLRAGPVLLADDTDRVVAGEVHRKLALSDPGIEDYRNELLWSPERPTLIHADLTLADGAGAAVDAVQSYTALRSIAVRGDRSVLNGRPSPLRLVLDQGYWPDTGPTAPDAAALRRDVELAKAMGFNGVRKHQKIEDPRYLYWPTRWTCWCGRRCPTRTSSARWRWNA